MNEFDKEKLIEKDIKAIENRVRHAFNQGYEAGLKHGREQEPKIGHWVKKSQYGNDYCSECDYELLMCGKPKFCPDCGAKMESEVKE